MYKWCSKEMVIIFNNWSYYTYYKFIKLNFDVDKKIVHGHHVICQLFLSAIRISAFSHSLNTDPAILRKALLYAQVSC